MSQDFRQLEKTLNTAMKTGRCFLGYRESIKNAKGSKLIVISSKAPPRIIDSVEKAANTSQTPIYKFPGSPKELGRLLGKRFPVSTATIRAKGDADLSILTSELGS